MGRVSVSSPAARFMTTAKLGPALGSWHQMQMQYSYHVHDRQPGRILEYIPAFRLSGVTEGIYSPPLHNTYGVARMRKQHSVSKCGDGTRIVDPPTSSLISNISSAHRQTNENSRRNLINLAWLWSLTWNRAILDVFENIPAARTTRDSLLKCQSSSSRLPTSSFMCSQSAQLRFT